MLQIGKFLREGRRMPRLLVGDECDGTRFKYLEKRPSRDAPTFGRRDSLFHIYHFNKLSLLVSHINGQRQMRDDKCQMFFVLRASPLDIRWLKAKTIATQ